MVKNNKYKPINVSHLRNQLNIKITKPSMRIYTQRICDDLNNQHITLKIACKQIQQRFGSDLLKDIIKSLQQIQKQPQNQLIIQ